MMENMVVVVGSQENEKYLSNDALGTKERVIDRPLTFDIK